MEPNIFSPRLKAEKDTLGDSLRTLAQGVLVFVFGILPIFFIPGVYTALGFTKVYFVVLGVFAALVFLSLAILRSGSVRLVVPPALALFWLFAILALASGLLSGDVADSLFGNVLEVHTVGFMMLMALVMTVSFAFVGAKSAVARLFTALGLGALILQVFHLARLVFGPEVFAFGLFTSPTISLVGSFNDLAIFSGLVVVVTLVVMQQLAARLSGKILGGFLILSSLILMSVVNFYLVWVVVGFMSLLTALYLISKDTWLKTSADVEGTPVSRFTLAMVGVVCVFAAIFIISGDVAGAAVNRITGIDYLEIRPSASATLDITQSVVKENALFGAGPNRFEDAWRMYKDPVINSTLFWNTNFTGGSGFVPTLFVTTGLVGGVVFVLFLLAFLYLGYKTLFVTKITDYGWYLVGSMSFISALYLWTLSVLYVPGVTLLLLAALMTGVTFAVFVTVSAATGVALDVNTGRQYGLLLIAAVLVVIITSTLSVLSVSKQYLAGVVYAETVRSFQQGSDVATVDAGLARASELNPQDIFLAERAVLRLAELERLNLVPAAEFDEQRFAAVLAEGIAFAEQAIALDNTNPANYVLLSNFYGLLDPAEFEGIADRTLGLFARASELDPTNPSYSLFKAQYQARTGDLVATRASLMEAMNLKNDYTAALFLLSQLDIEEGKTEDAIALTRAMISIEPANPTRYFQLGVLLATTGNLEGAVAAFEAAVGLDNNYANARYFLALTYLDQNRPEDALIQLNIVKESNADNAALLDLINQVESGTYVRPESGFDVPVEEGAVVNQEADVTTTSEVPDTDLVTPLNRGTETSGEAPSEENPPAEQ